MERWGRGEAREKKMIPILGNYTNYNKLHVENQMFTKLQK